MHAITVARISALCHCSVSSHSPVKSYCNSSLVNLAFISLLSPSNPGSHSLPLGSSPWLTLTDTDHSYSSPRWQGTSVSKFFCHSGFVVIISWVCFIFLLTGFGRYSRDRWESWREAAALHYSWYSQVFSRYVPRGSRHYTLGDVCLQMRTLTGVFIAKSLQ